MLFLSHSSDDKMFVRFLARELEQCGHDYWLDENQLHAGAELSAAINIAIRAAERVLVFLSRSSARSVWVEREIAEARAAGTAAGGIGLIPCVMGEMTDDEIPQSFKDVLYVDFRKPEIYDVQFCRLLRSLSPQHRPPALPNFDADRADHLIDAARSDDVRAWLARFLMSVAARRADETERYWIYITIARLSSPAEPTWFLKALEQERGFARKGVLEALQILHQAAS